MLFLHSSRIRKFMHGSLNITDAHTSRVMLATCAQVKMSSHVRARRTSATESEVSTIRSSATGYKKASAGGHQTSLKLRRRSRRSQRSPNELRDDDLSRAALPAPQQQGNSGEQPLPRALEARWASARAPGLAAQVAAPERLEAGLACLA